MSRNSANSPRRKAKQERARQTIEAVLTATAQVLKSSGYAATSTNQLADRAGVSIGSIYQYFSNKDELVDALIERVSERLTERLRQFDPDPEAPLEESLLELFSAAAHGPDLDPDLYRELERAPGFEKRVQKLREASIDAIHDFVAPHTPPRSRARMRESIRLLVLCAGGLGHAATHREFASRMGDEFAEMAGRHLLARMNDA